MKFKGKMERCNRTIMTKKEQREKIVTLAYVEWFTPFGRPDANMGLYSITRSTCHTHRYSTIVSVDSVLRGCLLMARNPREVPSTWTADNILEQGSIQYFFNPYIDVDTFTLFKLDYFQ